MEDLKYRVDFALPIGEKKRVSYRVNVDGYMEVILDVHGLKCRQAKRIINNILNGVMQRIHLTIIHGFNHGTAIREMLPKMENSHIVDMQLDNNNPGKTTILAA